jgi:energy-coupling factor transporter ATP-binding protein EcfA2
MKLKTARITNFRSVEDSGEFTLDQVLCLVGKNEAGKTAIVQALAGLNPHPSTPIVFDKERDYPRRFLTDYDIRHDGEEAVVVSTKWILEETEKVVIAELVGDALTGDSVTISRGYESEGPSWTLPINFAKAIEHLIQEERMNAAEKASIAGAKDTKSLRTALSAIATPTAKHTKLLERIDAFPGKTITGAIEHALKPGLPRFMYFSHYDRMDGQIRLRKASVQDLQRPHHRRCD